MSFTSEVSEFMETLGPFYEPVEEDEENEISKKLANIKAPTLTQANALNLDKTLTEKDTDGEDLRLKTPPSTISIEYIEDTNRRTDVTESIDSNSDSNQDTIGRLYGVR